MAVARLIPTCPFCGKEIAKAKYEDQRHLPHMQQTIGDTFIEWEFEEHTCKEAKEFARKHMDALRNPMKK